MRRAGCPRRHRARPPLGADNERTVRAPGPRRERKSLLEVAPIRADLGADGVRGAGGLSPVRIGRIGRAAAGRETFAPEAVPRLPF